MTTLDSRNIHICCRLLLCLVLGCESTQIIQAALGSTVTLTCRYNAKYYGRLGLCWGRGYIPNSGCANQVIKSDGTSVTHRLSERYWLMGNLDEGDVSLTIRQLQKDDTGMYGCRVEIPGWFNDHKHQMILQVVTVIPKPVTVQNKKVNERTITINWTPDFDGGSPITSYRIDLKHNTASWVTAVTTQGINPAFSETTLLDLRPANTYNIRMFAINSVGMSEASNVLTITTREAAPGGPPLDLKLEALTSHSIKVSWKPPRTDLHNGVLRSYSISFREFDAVGKQFKRWQYQLVMATKEQEDLTLTNLRPFTMYGVMVQAKTNAGMGPVAIAPLCSTLEEELATSTTEAIETTSTAATTWQETVITAATSTVQTIEPPIATVSGQSTPGFAQVNPTSTVQTIETTNAKVWGQSTPGFAQVPPDPPVVTLREVKDNTVTFSWTAGFDGGSPITGYDMEYKALNASWDSTKMVLDFEPNQMEAMVIEIHPSVYNIRMFARNILGKSEASNVLTVTVGETGHHRDDVHPTSSTVSPNAHLAMTGKESQGGHLTAIVVSLVLVMLIVAVATTWQLRRMKRRTGSFGLELTNGDSDFRRLEVLEESLNEL